MKEFFFLVSVFVTGNIVAAAIMFAFKVVWDNAIHKASNLLPNDKSGR
jgi:hypothetical protein